MSEDSEKNPDSILDEQQSELLRRYYGKVRSKVSFDEFLKSYREIQDHFGDLLIPEMASLLAAYEYGYLHESKISDLKNSRGKVAVRVEVKKILSVREFQKENDRGIVSRILIADETGQTVAVLWDDVAKLVKTGDIVPGSFLELRGFVKKPFLLNSNNFSELELSINDPSDVEIIGGKEYSQDTQEQNLLTGVVIGYETRKTKAGKLLRVAIVTENEIKILYGWNEIVERLHDLSPGDKITCRFQPSGDELLIIELVEYEVGDFSNISGIENLFDKISELNRLKQEKIVNVRGRVSGIGDFKRIRKDERLLELSEIYVSDNTGRIKVILWGEKAKIYSKLDIGDEIIILNSKVNSRVRSGKVECEVHCGWKSLLTINGSI
jgi:replication factor A1